MNSIEKGFKLKTQGILPLVGANQIFNDSDLKKAYEAEFGGNLDDDDYLASFQLIYDIVRIRFSTQLNLSQKRILISYVGKLYKGDGILMDAYSKIYSATGRNEAINSKMNLNYNLDTQTDQDKMNNEFIELTTYIDNAFPQRRSLY